MSLLKRTFKFTAIALLLCMTAAHAQQTIWNSTHAAVSATNRIPVDTSSLGGPGYNSIGDIFNLVNGDCTINLITGQITCTKTSGSSFAAVATSGSASDLSTGTLAAARLPNPATNALGGVEAINAVGSKWINSISISGVPSLTQPNDSDLAFTDIVTNNSSTSKHGFLKKLTGTATQYMDGSGNWSTPAGTGISNLTGPIISVGNTTSVAAQTGTGSTFVMNNGPTLIAPALGTPASGNMANVSGTATALNIGGNAGTVSTIGGLIAAGTNVTITGAGTLASPSTISASGGGGGGSPAGSNGDIQINSSGSFGAFTPASGIKTFLTTPTSANLAAAITDETGTGAAVFAGSPTFTGTVTAPILNLTTVNTGLEIGGSNGIFEPSNDTTTGGSVGVGAGALGFQSLLSSNTYWNTAVGYQAGGGAAATQTSAAVKETAIGAKAGWSITTGDSDTMVGYKAGLSITTGIQNACFGDSGCEGATTQTMITCLGSEACNGAGGGSGNGSIGNYGIGIGVYTKGGLGAVAIGYQALQTNYGNYDVAIGYNAGASLGAGATNVILGNNVASTTLASGSNNILIGVDASTDTAASSTSNTVMIKGTTGGTAVLSATATNTSTPVIVLGNATVPTATDTLMGRATTDTETNKTFDTAATGNVFKINGTQISSVSGNTAKVATASGTLTNGHCVQFDGSGNIVDAGGACTTGGGGGTVSSGTAGQLTYYASTGTTVAGNSDANISSGALTLGIASTTAGSIVLEGATSGAATIAASSTGGTLVLGATSATTAIANIFRATPHTVTVTSNAGTVPVATGISNFTNSSSATMTITLATSGASDGDMAMVRIYDFAAVSETISWVNTENSGVSVPATSNGSTTLPLTVGYQFNGATSKWRCLGYE